MRCVTPPPFGCPDPKCCDTPLFSLPQQSQPETQFVRFVTNQSSIMPAVLSRPHVDLEVEREEHRKLFDAKVQGYLNEKGVNTRIMTKERHDFVVKELQELKSKPNKERNYSLAQRYAVTKIGGATWLVPKNQKNASVEATERIVHTGELFDKIFEEHVAIGHGKHTALHKQLGTKYANIPRDIVDMFCKCCPR